MNQYTQYAVDHFFREKGEQTYFVQENSQEDEPVEKVLEEDDIAGKTQLRVSVKGESLWLINFDMHDKCAFLSDKSNVGLRKCSDHVIFQRKGEAWYLHIIELKTAVGAKTWQDVKRKFRASYFNCMAIARILDIDIPDSHVRAYTTYEREQFGRQTTLPVTLKPRLGEEAQNPMQEWNNNLMRFEKIACEVRTFQHQKLQMTRDERGLGGSLTIS